MLDATHVKTRRIAANGVKNTGGMRVIGRMKGGLNSKLHLGMISLRQFTAMLSLAAPAGLGGASRRTA